jgi:hypothetical protein
MCQQVAAWNRKFWRKVLQALTVGPILGVEEILAPLRGIRVPLRGQDQGDHLQERREAVRVFHRDCTAIHVEIAVVQYSADLDTGSILQKDVTVNHWDVAPVVNLQIVICIQVMIDMTYDVMLKDG